MKPASLKPSAGRRIVDPWTLIYSYGFGECLDLSYLLTTGASVLGLPVRVLDLQSHMVAEIRYGDAWHVYDLTYCYGLHDAQGRAPSFAEVSSGGGLKKWTDHHRPWLLGGLVNDTWRNLPTIAPQELPAGWDTAPEPLVLRPGDSWSLYAATVEKLRGARRSDEIDQPAALGVLDLAPSAGPRRMQLPFPLLRVLLTANGADEPLPLPVGVTLDRPPGYVVRNAWRRTAGGWELPLADLRTRIEPIKSFAVTIPDTLLTRARLRIEMACAASWLIAPDPGLTVLAVDWQDGDALELTLRWRQK